MLPLGFLLTQYTITGFDACAHVSEETQGAATAAARGLWQSIFYSAIGGWILLLAFLFAATDVDAINAAGGFVGAIFNSALRRQPGHGDLRDLHDRPVLLRDELRDLDVPDDLRLLPGRRDPRLAAVVEGRPQPDPGQRDHLGLRAPR